MSGRPGAAALDAAPLRGDRHTGSRASWAFAVALLALAGVASAQEGPTTFEFNFSNPGARSLGFGGAFAALADDATAAFANPSGLVQLARPEVSVEVRRWSFATSYTAGGRVSGLPSGEGIDTTAGLRFGTSHEALEGLSYLSVVLPREGWSLAFFRHQLADFRAQSTLDGLFGDHEAGVRRINDLRQRLDFRVVSQGVAAGVQIHERLSVGAALVVSRGDVALVSESYDPPAPPAGFFGPNPFAPEGLEQRVRSTLRDTALTVTAGLLWRATDRWRIGTFFRQGAAYHADLEVVAGPASDFLPPGTVQSSGTPFRIPDVLGAGGAYRSLDGAWTVSLEWDRVRYGQIFDALESELLNVADLGIDDGDEVHLGVEYAFLASRPVVALRGGWWLDPDHHIVSTGRDVFERAVFRSGGDERHLSAGVGVAFRRVQVDLAADLSRPVDTVSLSLIASF